MIHGIVQSIISHLKEGNRIRYENRSVTSSEILFPQGRRAELSFSVSAPHVTQFKSSQFSLIQFSVVYWHEC